MKVGINYIALKKQTLIHSRRQPRPRLDHGRCFGSDVRIVQSLIDAGRRIERAAGKSNASISTVIFLRDDVYDWPLSEAADRGKDSTVRVQWREPELLRQLVERRLEAASADLLINPPLRWNNITRGDILGEPIFDYLVQHCLRRPRSLLDLIELCLSNATLAGRAAIFPEDAERAVAAYSADMLHDLNYEVRDVFPQADKIIYSFAKENFRLDQRNVERGVNRQLKDPERSTRFIRMMLWFGFFGVIGADATENYIFDHGDDIELLRSHAGKCHGLPTLRSARALQFGISLGPVVSLHQLRCGLLRFVRPGRQHPTQSVSQVEEGDDYAAEIEQNLADLHARVNSGEYRALPSRRAYIPEADGKRRTLGIPI